MEKHLDYLLFGVVAGLFFALLIWAQVEQGINRSKHLTEQQIQAMQMEVRARSIAKYGTYEE